MFFVAECRNALAAVNPVELFITAGSRELRSLKANAAVMRAVDSPDGLQWTGRQGIGAPVWTFLLLPLASFDVADTVSAPPPTVIRSHDKSTRFRVPTYEPRPQAQEGNLDVYSLASIHIFTSTTKLKFGAEPEERYYRKHRDLWDSDRVTFRFALMASGMILMLGVALM